MKLKPIKYPKKINFANTDKRKFRFIQDKNFLLIRTNSKFIEVGVCSKKTYKLIKAFRGKDIKNLYKTIISEGYISRNEHAAYLGKELSHALFCLKNKKKYIQGKA